MQRKTITGVTLENTAAAKKATEQKGNTLESSTPKKLSTQGHGSEIKNNNSAGPDQGNKQNTEQKSGNLAIRSPQETISNGSNEQKQTTPLLPIDGDRAKSLNEKELSKLNKRSFQLLQTIEFTGPSIKVDIYDNGQVDGDVISIFLNDKLLLPAKMLTAEPISLVINADYEHEYYDLIMYAESMGKIPPNTALMIVTTSTNRYEINITSTEQSSGVVRFKPKR